MKKCTQLTFLALAALAAAPARSQDEARSDDSGPSVKLKGDLRFRFENISDDSADLSRFRNRIRARLGVDASLDESLKVVLLAATAEDADPLSTNQTLGANAAQKPFDLNQAYVDWSGAEGLHVLGGKMANPHFAPVKSSLVFDSDYTPEGAALTYAGEAGDLQYKLVTSAYWILENSVGKDVNLFGEQFAVTYKTDAFRLMAGASYYSVNQGFGFPLAYSLIEGMAEVGFDVAELPLTIGFDYVTNTEADDDNTAWLAGLSLGSSKKAGDWSVGYAYRKAEALSVLGILTDSDVAGGGADVKGHEFMAGYKFTDAAGASLKWILAAKGVEADMEYSRLQADLSFSF